MNMVGHDDISADGPAVFSAARSKCGDENIRKAFRKQYGPPLLAADGNKVEGEVMSVKDSI
jgi:hypothetical protein